jgi:hypothetical protein
MQIEKRLIACSILALAIGIAVIVPLAFFMNAKAETFDYPWFNVSVPYAYFKANSTSHSYQTTSAIALNCTVNADAIRQHADARVEYFEFQIYSDQGQISNVTYFLATNSSKVEDPISMFAFSRENWFNSTAGGGGYFVTNLTAPLPLMRTGQATSYYVDKDDWINTHFGETITQIESANVIYLDVRRLGYVTFDGNNTIVTLADNQVIQHLELTKKGDAFTYGEAPGELMLTAGELPFPEPQY